MSLTIRAVWQVGGISDWIYHYKPPLVACIDLTLYGVSGPVEIYRGTGIREPYPSKRNVPC